MSRNSKRTVTATLMGAAGIAVLVALVLAGGDRASASRYKDTNPVVTDGVTLFKVTPEITPPPGVPTVKRVEPLIKRGPITAEKEPIEPPEVDVVFVLDTTGSMSGLISGAKRKIWSMANQIVSGQPRPDVRIGLVGYRDRGDAYVTRRYQLTENIDDVYSRLQRFRADGGGDTPEHVNRALADALRRMDWRQGQKVLKLVFLVGDAPPHEGRDGLHSSALAREATKKGIIINTVRCGRMGSTAVAWKRIASLSGGRYASIRQDGAMVAMHTPYDRKLTELNAALSRTLLPTGSATDKAAARTRGRANAAMGTVAQAESAAYRASSGKLDSADLLSVLRKGKDLDELREAELPAPVAAMPRARRKAYVDGVAKKRAALKREIARVNKERQAHLRAQRKPGKATSFDDTLGAALKDQGAKIGVAY